MTLNFILGKVENNLVFGGIVGQRKKGEKKANKITSLRKYTWREGIYWSGI